MSYAPLYTRYFIYIISPHHHNNNPAKWIYPHYTDEGKEMEAHIDVERVEPGLSAFRVYALSTAPCWPLSAQPAILLALVPSFVWVLFFQVFRFPAIFLFVPVPEEANLSQSSDRSSSSILGTTSDSLISLS